MGNVTTSSMKVQQNRKQDLTGKRFGKLTALEYDREKQKWKCQCDCGNICEKPTGELNAGTATSCGCSWRQPAVHEGDRFGRFSRLEDAIEIRR